MVKMRLALIAVMGFLSLLANAADSVVIKKKLPGPHESRDIYNKGMNKSDVIKKESKELLYNSLKINDSIVRAVRASMKPYGSVLVILNPAYNKRDTLMLIDDSIGREWNDCSNVIFNGHGSPLLNAIYNSVSGYIWGDGQKRYDYLRKIVEHADEFINAAKSTNPIDDVLKQIDYVFYDFPVGAKESLKIQMKQIYNTKGPKWLTIGQHMYDNVEQSALIVNNPHMVVFPKDYDKIEDIVNKNRIVCKNTTNEWVRPDKEGLEKEFERSRKALPIPLEY